MNVRRRRLLAVALSSVVAATLPACANAPEPPVETPTPTDDAESEGHAEASWVRSWDTFEDVLSETTLVIVGEATRQEKIPSTEDAHGAEDTTLTTFSVSKSWGSDVTEALVRSTDGFSADEAASYDVGQEYLVYLAEFDFQPGVPTGTHIAVGQVAAYRLVGDDARRITTRDGLPRKATTDELVEHAVSKFP